MGIWLASASERRSQILSDMFGEIHVEALPDVDETPPFGDVRTKVLEICKRKASAVKNESNFDYVIVADTMIEDPEDINLSLGKANDEFEAATMLLRLSGRRHLVWSATGILIAGDWTFFVESAVVEFSELSQSDIEDLVKSGIDLNFQDKLGMTALMHSIEKGNVNAVNLLVRENFDKDLTDFSGQTIFDYADSSRNLLIKKMVKTLDVSN